MGRLQKVSNQNKISVFETLINEHVPVDERQPEMKITSPTSRQEETEARAAEKRAEWEVVSESPKLSHNNPTEIDLVRRGSSVRSASCAPDGITNEGGSGKYIGSSRNSVANAEFLDQVSKMQTKKEATVEEKRASAAVREMRQNEFRASPRIGESEEAYLNTRGNSVTPNHAAQGSRGMPGIGQISIFDDKDFERIPEHKMEIRERKEDNSWREPKKAHSTKNISQNLFDKLADQPDQSQHKSLQEESTDRLYEAILNNMKNQE